MLTSGDNPERENPARSRSLQPGQILADRYLIVTLIGHGGMGEVYEARDTALKLSLALKTIRGDVTEGSLRRFQREVVLARSIAHPNVCRVFDFGSDPAAGAFFTMELLRGENLSEVLKRRGPLPVAEARSIVSQVADALAAAHAHGVVHRDLKPGNIFITFDGRVVVTDFGLARAAADSPAADDVDTHSNIVSGTPAYMPPEQLTGAEATPSVDLYALGVVMYEMTTGKLPWKDSGGYSRFTATPPPPGINPSWDSAILRCLAPEPSGRFHSASDLRLAVLGQSVRRMPRWAPYVATGLLLVGLVAAGLWFGFGRHRWTPRPEAVAWYARGVAALHSGDYNSAAKQLQMAADADPGFAMAYARLAQAWAEQDFADLARQSMLQASTVAASYPPPERIDEIRLLAIQMTVAREFSGSLQRYQEIAQSQRNADTLFDLARAYERSSRTDDAIATCREAIRLQNSHAAAWARLGTLLGRKGDYAEAAAAFDKAEAIHNAAGNLAGTTEVRLMRAVVLTLQGQTAEATRVLRSALQLAEATGFESQRIRVLLRLGVVARMEEKGDEAERYASEALRLANENRMEQYSMDGLLDLGNVYLQKRDLASAEKHYANAIRIARSLNSRFHQARAAALIASVRSQQSRLEEARAGAEKALSFFRSAGYRSEALGTLALLGQIRSLSGDAPGALAAFEEQLRLTSPTNARALAAGHLRVGIALSQLERYPEALPHLEQALSAPDSVTRAYAAVKKAEILTETGMTAEAARLLQDEKLLSEPSGAVRTRARAIEATAAWYEGRTGEAMQLAESTIRSLRDEDPVLKVQMEVLMARALAQSGRSARALDLCNTLQHPSANARVSGTVMLGCAEVELIAGRDEAAARDAEQAGPVFAKLGRPEAQWRACITSTLALHRRGASQSPERCDKFRNSVADRWGPALFARYLKRADVRTQLNRLEHLSGAASQPEVYR